MASSERVDKSNLVQADEAKSVQPKNKKRKRSNKEEYLRAVRLGWVYVDSVVKDNLQDCKTTVELQIETVNVSTRFQLYVEVTLELLHRVSLSESGEPQGEKQSLDDKPSIRLTYTHSDTAVELPTGNWHRPNKRKSSYLLVENIAIEGVEIGHDYYLGGKIRLVPFGVTNLPQFGLRYHKNFRFPKPVPPLGNTGRTGNLFWLDRGEHGRPAVRIRST